MPIVLGSERVLAAAALDGRRVGVVCNPASVDAEFRHVADRLAAHPRARLSAIFGPQHGFRSDVQDNMIETRHGVDEIRRVPVYSLYSETREPTADMLRDLYSDLRTNQIDLLFAQVRGSVRDRMRKTGLVEHVGEDHLYQSIDAAVQAFLARPALVPSSPPMVVDTPV